MNDMPHYFKVTATQTFIKFLGLLGKGFLEASIANTEKAQGSYDNLKRNISANERGCSTFADIFKGARIYE